MEKSFAGRVVVVTGASRGIGEAIAEAFGAAGARVVLASRKLEGVEGVAAKIRAAGGEALAVACHTGREADVQALMARAHEAFGALGNWRRCLRNLRRMRGLSVQAAGTGHQNDGTAQHRDRTMGGARNSHARLRFKGRRPA